MSTTATAVRGLRLDLAHHTAMRGDQPIELDETEWALLGALLLAGGDPVDLKDLLPYISGPTPVHEEAYLLIAVWHLRHKLELDPAKPALIKTTRNGYRLDPCAQYSCTCRSAAAITDVLT